MHYLALCRYRSPYSGELLHIGDGSTEYGEVYYNIIDPWREIQVATGTRYAPQLGVMSMVAGIHAAGHEVMIEYAWDPHHPPIIRPPKVLYRYQGDFQPDPVFFLFGAAWARDEWDTLKRSLQKYLIPSKRMGALKKIGARYQRNPRGPIGLWMP